jgi:hypothetical protein
LVRLGLQKIYNSIDNCPVWYYSKLSETGDLRYLIHNSDKKLPNIYNVSSLEKAKNQLLDSDKKNDFKLLKLYYNAYKHYLNFLIDTKNETKYNLAFKDYLFTLDRYYKEYKINNILFYSALSAYKYVTEQLTYAKCLELRLKIFDPEKLDHTKSDGWDIYRDLILLSEQLNQKFDAKIVTVSEYYAAVDILKQRNIKQNGR